MSIQQLFTYQAVASTPEAAAAAGVSEARARAWAHEHNLPRAGNSFAWTLEATQQMADELQDEEDEEDEEDGDGDGHCVVEFVPDEEEDEFEQDEEYDDDQEEDEYDEDQAAPRSAR